MVSLSLFGSHHKEGNPDSRQHCTPHDRHYLKLLPMSRGEAGNVEQIWRRFLIKPPPSVTVYAHSGWLCYLAVQHSQTVGYFLFSTKGGPLWRSTFRTGGEDKRPIIKPIGELTPSQTQSFESSLLFSSFSYFFFFFSPRAGVPEMGWISSSTCISCNRIGNQGLVAGHGANTQALCGN